MQLSEATYKLDALDRGQIDRTIRAFWAERLANSERAIRKYFSDDVEFRLLGGPQSLPGPRVFSGINSVVEAVKFIDTNLEFLSFDIRDIIIDGNQVALRWHAGFRNRGTGVVGDLAVLDYIVLQNGKITVYAEYLDTQGLDYLMAGESQTNLARISNRKCLFKATFASVQDIDVASLDLDARNTREQLLRDFWQTRVRLGSVALRDYCTPDFELHLIGDPVAIPFARVHAGLEAACELVDRIDTEFEFIAFEVRTVLIDGEKGALQWSADVRHRGTSALGYIDGFDQVLFEDGRFKSFTEFFDTAQVARCMLG